MMRIPFGYFTKQECEQMGYPVKPSDEHIESEGIYYYKRWYVTDQKPFYTGTLCPSHYLTIQQAQLFRETNEPDAFWETHCVIPLYDCSAYADFVHTRPNGYLSPTQMEWLSVPLDAERIPDCYLVSSNTYFHQRLTPLYDCRYDKRWRLKSVTDDTFDPLREWNEQI